MNTDLQPGIVSTLSDDSRSIAEVYGVDMLCRFTGTTSAERRLQLNEIHLLETGVLVNEQELCEVTIGLTAGGFRRLGVAAGILALLPDVFLAGAGTRAERLGDPPIDQTDVHAMACSGESVDVIVMISSISQAMVAEVSNEMEAAGLEVVASLPTYLETDRREHFGFKDGISNPPLEGCVRSGDPSIVGAGVKVTKLKTPETGDWRPLAAGEILLGRTNEAGVIAGARVVQDLIRNGSFLVWRKIEQNVAGFTALAQAMTGLTPPPPGQTNAEKAKLIGRNQNGTPLVGDEENSFDYSDPVTNAAVTLHAHIRRANPRATPGFSDARTRKVPLSQTIGNPERTYGAFHRIVRRSMLWKEPANSMKPERVGTIFRCYQADIVDQFEFIQRNWLNSGDPFREGRLVEPVGGMHTESPLSDSTIIDPRSAEKNRLPCPMSETPVTFNQLTTPLATLYALVPGHQALDDLAANRFGGL
jgi:Dyp-type peroxidase family